MRHKKQPSLFSAITIGVGGIVGSGWLFASYYASQYAGPISILSWIIGAACALILALLLSEITTMYQETGLFSRLLTITHNQDYGFIVAISNWLAMIACIASEAMASVEYIGYASPNAARIMFNHGSLTWPGLGIVYVVIFMYGLLNYWGIRMLSKANNMITTIKMLVPAAIGIIFMLIAFHPSNFTSYKHTVAPYGFSKVFSAIVNCGIFYAFYGFSNIAVFAKELKNPKRNIPLALVGSVLICLVIYLILQVSFLGAVDPRAVAASGWHALQFKSPLADLALILGINWVAIVLYVDAAISPSGTAIIYAGSAARMLYAMADDKQMPRIFATINHKYLVSRISLVVTLLLCGVLVIHFDSWKKIMLVVTVFQLISCLAIPIAFGALRRNEPNKERLFKVPAGSTINLIAYLVVSYLLVDCGFQAIMVALLVHVVLFIIYCASYYKFRLYDTYNAVRSSWSMFIYQLVILMFAIFRDRDMLNQPRILVSFFVVMLIFYMLLIRQKSYSAQVANS